jgi:signal transduction histidine kinase/ActR/RegA family two-component response regulator
MRKPRWPRASGSEPNATPVLSDLGDLAATAPHDGALPKEHDRASGSDSLSVDSGSAPPTPSAASTLEREASDGLSFRQLRASQQRLVRANLALLRQLRPGGAVQWATNDVRSIVNATYAALLLLDGPEATTGTFAQSGIARGMQSRIPAERPEARGFLGAVAASGRSIRLPDLRLHPAFTGFPPGHPQMTSFVAAPLIRNRKVIGLLYATNKKGGLQFTADDERFVTRVAAELARSRLLLAEPEAPELMERIAVVTRSLRKEMEATRSFLSNLSHELRGSISGIMLSSELLTDPSFGGLNEAQLRAVGQRIHNVADNLLALVDNLLDLGRLEAGRLDVRLQPVSLADTLNDVSGVVSPLADASEVALELPALAGMPRVAADPIRLRQVLSNLLTNAIKFTPAGGRVWLECEARDETMLIAVCDTGRGIPASELERIFEPFERAGEARVPGVGLGLPISRRVVELHGGHLEVVSEPGKGSRFWFSLRRSREPPPPRLLRPPGNEAAVMGADGTPASVLLVEDDPVSRDSIRDVLAATGYRVRSVDTRGAALHEMAAAPVDLVLLDVHLPDGSGLDIVGELRAAADRPLAVVALSADRVGNVAGEAMAAGCDRFGLKPLAARELLDLVAEVVGSRQGPPSRS